MFIADINQRTLALDISKSFIVQAPAGSGKTSLLVQRFLALLACAEAPEEIVAITFTKKAAAEIKDRVLDAVAAATAVNTLAQNAAQRNQEKKWHLLENPNRLRIQTIDSLSYSIVKRVPILAQLEATDILENQALETCYSRAITALFTHPTAALKNLLLHLNNDLNKAEKLLIALLKKREQWLHYIVATKNNPEQLKTYLESTLLTIVNENIEKCRILLAPKLAAILDLVNFARRNLQLIDFINNNFCMVLEHWEFIAKILLTQEFTWRKSIDARNGFPAVSAAKNQTEKILRQQKKEQIKTLLEELQTNEPIRQSLENILHSPATIYTDSEWNIILSLCELLPLLVAELKLIFHEQQAVDYAEILMSADYALGTADNPSALALNLDYKIQHLLIDEFQDTSLAQYSLIEKLIAGWQEGDGRTLFLVGDPMQSIYRFRQAEVGLFLRTQTEKIGALKLELITLTTNFRSNQSIIEWINTNFQKILPATSDINYGAIPFTPSFAANAISNENSVQIQLLTDVPPDAEAEHIVTIVKKIHYKNPHETIAILARSRTHLKAILPALNQAQLNYQAVELANLSDTPIIKDLLALTRALLDLTDRIAWLAILRAPWCGLALTDLHAIANGVNSLIIENLRIHETLNLSSDGKIRLAKFVPIILQNLYYIQRQNLSTLIENTWYALAGPSCINAVKFETAELFFQLLRNNEKGGTIDLQFLERSLDSLFAKTTNEVTTLQVMTIHKAKGLEFDHVIIPGINRQLKNDDHPLLLWAEYIKLHQGNNLLLVPLASNPNTINKNYAYLWHLEQQKNKYETGRLLYVAMTRAKKSVYLTGTITNHTNKNDNKINGLNDGSLLSQLTLSFNESWIIPSSTVAAKHISKLTETKLERLPANFDFPKISKTAAAKIPFQPLDDKTSVGTIIHQYLERISNDGLDRWTDNYILTQQENIKRELMAQGCFEVEKYLPIVTRALCNIISDSRGRWILSIHTNDRNEYRLTAVLDGEIRHLVVDRTFSEDGKTWIIDYKTATPDGDLNLFLEQQKLIYREQLEEYAIALRPLIGNEPIHLGLYFPLCRGWIEWEKIMNN